MHIKYSISGLFKYLFMAAWLLLAWLGSMTGAYAADAAVYYIQTDQLNTPRVITDQNQAVVWKWDSDGFGATPPNEQPGTAPAFTFNPRFAGQYFDRESNLHYNYYRDYDPQIGRYVQSDPIGLNGGINTYGYVGGDPITRIDPDGRFFFVLFLGPSLATAIADLTVAGGATWIMSKHADVQRQANPSDADLQRAIEKEANRREYKNRCDEPPPTGLDQCELAKWNLNKARECKALRNANSDRWYGGPDQRHLDHILNFVDPQIRAAEKAVERSCKCS